MTLGYRKGKFCLGRFTSRPDEKLYEKIILNHRKLLFSGSGSGDVPQRRQKLNDSLQLANTIQSDVPAVDLFNNYRETS